MVRTMVDACRLSWRHCSMHDRLWRIWRRCVILTGSIVGHIRGAGLLAYQEHMQVSCHIPQGGSPSLVLEPKMSSLASIYGPVAQTSGAGRRRDVPWRMKFLSCCIVDMTAVYDSIRGNKWQSRFAPKTGRSSHTSMRPRPFSFVRARRSTCFRSESSAPASTQDNRIESGNAA
jgi:hypothetical protein